MSPILLMVFVLIAAALVFMGPDPYAKQKELEAKYGTDKLVREINMRNDGVTKSDLIPSGDAYKPPKGAKVYKLPDYMVVEKKEKSGPLDLLKGEKPKEIAPPPEIPMEQWGKSEGKSKLNSGINDSGIKYEQGLPTTFAQPDAPKLVPVEPLGEK